MRLWSLHPCYLDRLGLVSVWREALLAKAVLENKTKRYKTHPQLNRFKKCEKPIEAINCFLKHVYDESKIRGYKFDFSKIGPYDPSISIPVTNGQIKHEFHHLQYKLNKRDKDKYQELKKLSKSEIKINPIFSRIEGGIESFEKIK